jgi:hypothetical protein
LHLKKKLDKKRLLLLQSIRYLPTKSNWEIWRLEKEIRALILKAVKERKEEASGNETN